MRLVDILDFQERKTKIMSLSGQSIIDCMFISPELILAVKKSGYNIFDQVIMTDHRGMYIDFDTELLFGSGDTKLANEKLRMVKAKDPYMVKEYIDKVHKYFDNHNFWSLHSSLMQSKSHNAIKAERVDKILLDAYINGEKSGKHRKHSWWSSPLA